MDTTYAYKDDVTGCKNVCTCVMPPTTTLAPQLSTTQLEANVLEPQYVTLCRAEPEVKAVFRELNELQGDVNAHITVENSLEPDTWAAEPDLFPSSVDAETARGHCQCRCEAMAKCKAVRVDFADQSPPACYFLKKIGPPIATFRKGRTYLKFTPEN